MLVPTYNPLKPHKLVFASAACCGPKHTICALASATLHRRRQFLSGNSAQPCSKPIAKSVTLETSGAANMSVHRSPKLVTLAAAIFCVLSFLPNSSHAQKRPLKSAPALHPITEQCTQNVELLLTATPATQGSLLLAELRSATPLTDLKGQWNKHDLEFWGASPNPNPRNAAAKKSAPPLPNIYRALVGVDLAQPPGSYDLAVTATTADAAAVSCTLAVPVSEGHFATESLHVDQKFVEPDPAQQARAAAEGQRLNAVYDHVTPERLWQGPFRMPLAGITKGTNFGKRRILNGQPRSPHTGMDFPSPTGTTVYATQRGRVALADSLYFPGNTVIVDHGLGVYSFYCHLSVISVKEGDLVAPGDILGKVGATGRVTGPHLHWGLTVDKARVNPLSIVSLTRSIRGK